ncbi:MAG: NifB/NifX family molybdenum-iron cluster-binding protein [Candidatus Cloacimonadaceae bacterium]|jgi:predicted Fe-Mo cluster-binding NifX family protein|nr:NifB/NifX family molybdenum-iron cluster-binding protein [Candidatus Cloacimonadota bacterium]MDX9949616.1 NifB/NifX family molybdenum-iron cluster-binding protein [Candidatus Syntrophosphaera sp.]
MIIVFTSKGTDWDAKMDPRFGRTDYLLFYNEETKELSHIDNREVANQAHGVGPKTAQILFERGAKVLITGNGPGGNAAQALKQMELKIFVGAGEMTVREAYEAYQRGQLAQGA